MGRINFAGRTVDLPRNRLIRMAVGVALIIFGIFGFLPVLGFWMIPLGLMVLSVDLPMVRRWRRIVTVKAGKWIRLHWPGLWRRFRADRSRHTGRIGCE